MISLRARARQGQETLLQLAPGRFLAGGGTSEPARIPGLPPESLDLNVLADEAIVVARCPGFQVAGHPLRVAERRLLRPGGKLAFGEIELELVSPMQKPAEGTAALAQGLLAGALKRARGASVTTLVWLNGPDCGKRLPILDEAVFLGRGDGAIAKVRDGLASRVHARLVLKDGIAKVVDLGSTNGLLVDGAKVDGERALLGGEILQIGDTEIAFDSRQGPAASPSPAPLSTAAHEPRATTSPEHASDEPIRPEPAPRLPAPDESEKPKPPESPSSLPQPAGLLSRRRGLLEAGAIAGATLAAAGGALAAWLLG